MGLVMKQHLFAGVFVACIVAGSVVPVGGAWAVDCSRLTPWEKKYGPGMGYCATTVDESTAADLEQANKVRVREGVAEIGISEFMGERWDDNTSPAAKVVSMMTANVNKAWSSLNPRSRTMLGRRELQRAR
jgi:hypothetical protein